VGPSGPPGGFVIGVGGKKIAHPLHVTDPPGGTLQPSEGEGCVPTLLRTFWGGAALVANL